MKDNLMPIITFVLFLIGGIALSFGVTYGLIWVICWSFDIAFSMRLVVGIYAICCYFTLLIS